MMRHALASDLPQITESLVHAFADDPLMAWIYPDDASRRARLHEFMGLTLEVGLTRGHTYHVADRRGAAVWSPPDVDFFGEHDGPRFGALMNRQLGDRAGEVLGGLANLLKHHPHGRPYFYLSTIGIHAERQGQGLGAALLGPMLERCDEQGLLTYLESSNPQNVPFYQRHGFEVTAEVALGENGPVVRPMEREAR